MKSLLQIKWHAVAFLFFGPFFAGMFPLWFLRIGWRPNHVFMSSLVCFGGGMLLSVSLVHLLPEIRAETVEYGRYVEVLLCVAMFVLYFADELGHCITRRRPEAEERRPLLYDRQPAFNPSYVSSTSISDLNSTSMADLVTSWGLTTKFWVHGVLEGLAVGLEDTTSTVVLLFVAVFAHRLTDAFSLGVDFATTVDSKSLKPLLSMLLYAASAPLGTAVGMAFPHMPALQCFAAGTLLYLSVFEVLFGEKACSHRRDEIGYEGVAQCFSYASGFAVVTALTFTIAQL